VRRYIGISAGLLLLGMGIIGPAAAQAVFPPPGFRSPALPGFEIMRVVSSHGLTPVTRPVRRGRNYVLLATDKSGQEMRVEVDARLGDIVGLRAPIPGEPFGPPIGTAALPPPGGAPTAVFANRPPSPPAELAPPRVAPNVSSPVVGAAGPPRAAPNVSNPVVGVAAPPSANPNPATAPVSAAPAPGRSAAAQPDLPPLPPPPPLPRPRPNLTAAEAAPETPAEPAAPKRRPPGVPAAGQPPKDSAGLIE
jgi:hypothetical protein